MTSSKRSPCLFIAAATLLSVSGCVPAPVQPPARKEVSEFSTPRAFLTCSQPAQPPTPDRALIGLEGGGLESGGNTLIILPFSVEPPRRQFTLEQERIDTVSVTVNRNVARVDFTESARLSIDLNRCNQDFTTGDWYVWRMDSTRKAGQKLETEIRGRRAVALIDSTSTYMMAN